MNVNDRAIGVLARAAAPAHDRRASIKALGAAVLGAALANPLTAEAKKRGKKGGNKRKKRCDKEKKQCRRAVEIACQDFPADPECRDLILPCCSSCKVKTALLCLIKAVA